jgi:hypothetical protein
MLTITDAAKIVRTRAKAVITKEGTEETLNETLVSLCSDLGGVFGLWVSETQIDPVGKLKFANIIVQEDSTQVSVEIGDRIFDSAEQNEFARLALDKLNQGSG